jgi:transcriptional regulator with XRE-family HTH domain
MPRERFGANLRRAREAAGLSQLSLQLSSGVHMTEISRYENGKKEPRLTTIVRLANGLDLPPAQLLADMDDVDASG